MITVRAIELVPEIVVAACTKCYHKLENFMMMDVRTIETYEDYEDHMALFTYICREFRQVIKIDNFIIDFWQDEERIRESFTDKEIAFYKLK